MMHKKRYRRILTATLVGVALLIIAVISFSSQKATREEYFAIKNGAEVKATLHYMPNAVYGEGIKNYYLYTFKLGGVTYAGGTVFAYYENDIDPDKFYVYCAVTETDGGREAVLSGAPDLKINDVEYSVALSREFQYFEIKKNAPSTSMSIGMFVISGFVFAYGLYNLIAFLMYRNLERSGTLTYAVFVEAHASKAGTNRYMAIRYKYKDEDDNWVEADSPYAYAAMDCEKLMTLETFKIRYKGKRSVIAEDIRNLRV